MHSRLVRPRDFLLAGAIVLLALLISTRYGRFVTPSNLVNVYNDTAILVMLAFAQMAVILTRCIDLSVAANLALTGMMVALLNASMPGVPILAIVLLAIAIGAVLGAINGAAGLAARHPAHRRDARHADDLSRPDLRDRRRRLGHRPPDERRLHGISARRVSSACRCSPGSRS